MAPEGSNGLPDPERIHTVLDDSKGYVVEVQNGPGGELYMVQVYGEGFGPGRIVKLTQGPVARIETDKTFGTSPLTVNFDASGSTDPTGRSLSYAWDLDGDGEFDDSTEATPSYTYTDSENHVARVKATNTDGQEHVASVTIYPGNSPPTPTVGFIGILERDADGNITGSRSAEGWTVGDEIAFNGFARDAEDPGVDTEYGENTMPTDSIRWDVTLHHCRSENDCHSHLVKSFAKSGGGGIIDAPDHAYPSYLEFTMTATDSEGLESEVTLRKDPKTVDLTFDSNPEGVDLTVGEDTQAGPFTKKAIVGSTNVVSAPETVDVAGGPYEFDSWSHGEERSHEVVAPEGDTLYTADYKDVGPPETIMETGPPEFSESTLAELTFRSSEEGSTFECSLNGTDFTECSSPQTYEQLARRDHAFRVRAIDSSGNVDPTPAEYTWTVSAAPPDTSITSGPSGLVNSRSAEFVFSSEEGATFECSLDGAGFGVCSSPQNYGELSDGDHTFEVRAVNQAGTPDPTPARSEWTVDAQPPETNIETGPPDPSGQPSAEFTFSASENDSTFLCSLDGVRYEERSSPKRYGELPDGSHTLRVKAVDRAGNADPSPAECAWTVDVTPPETAIDSGPAGSTSNPSATFDFSSSEEGSTFECSLDGGQFEVCASPKKYDGLANGAHSFRVRAVDRAGNVDASPAERAWSVDVTPLETTMDSGPAGSTNSTSATFEFSSNKAGSTFECSLNGASFSVCIPPKAYSGLSSRVHTFKVRAVDQAGNRDSSPAEFQWTVDRTGPNTSITSGPSGTVSSTSERFTFVSSESGSTFECRLDGDQFRACQSPHFLEGLSRGRHYFYVRAIDRAGNVDSSPASRSWRRR